MQSDSSNSKVRTKKPTKGGNTLLGLDPDSESDSSMLSIPRTRESKGKGRVDVMNQPRMMSSFLPSAKMKYMMTYLKDLLTTHPDEKVSFISSGLRMSDK